MTELGNCVSAQAMIGTGYRSPSRGQPHTVAERDMDQDQECNTSPQCAPFISISLSKVPLGLAMLVRIVPIG